MTMFAVPKLRQAITIHIGKGMKLEGIIFLEPLPGEVPLFKKVAAFLDESDEFFPFLVTESGHMAFINKDNTAFVEAEYSDGGGGGEFPAGFTHIDDVTVIFCDGAELHGSLMAEVPAEKSRLSDCLNLPGRFLCMKSGGRILHVNKRLLRKVISDGNRRPPQTD